VTPQALLDAGWDRIHYVRVDFSTATKLLDLTQSLTTRYGSLTNLLRQSGSRKDLALRLQEFKGIGPVTTRIFLRNIKSHSGEPFRPGLAERSKTQ